MFQKNGHFLWTIKQLIKEVEERKKQREVNQIVLTEQPNSKEQRVHSLLLPFADSKGTTIVQNLNKTLKNVLLHIVQASI